MLGRIAAPLRDLAAAKRQCTSTSVDEHRPWPMPERAWFMGQSWFDLLFAHWRVEPEQLHTIIPPQLSLDLIDGSAWVGITPFEVRALRLRYAPPPPFLSSFPELNVRTYVTVDDRPGIYFLSLDAGSHFAVQAARRSYRFPYFHAQMAVHREAGRIDYRSRRDSGPAAAFEAHYEPCGQPFNAVPDSLDWALIERYCAYTLDETGTVQLAQIHHPPWELRRARAEISLNTMTQPFALELTGEPLLHFAARQDVAIWRLEPA